MSRRVVITGVGILSPVGLTLNKAWDSIKNGISGISKVRYFDTTDFNSKIAGQVPLEFEDVQVVPPKDRKKMDMFMQYGLYAAEQAWQDSGIVINDINRDRVGVSIGTGIGGINTIETQHMNYINKGAKRISPFLVPGAINNMISGNFSIMHGLRGPNLTIVTACATGTHSIGEAARTIEYGDADIMVTGGAEYPITHLGLGGFASMRALSTRNNDPEKASRPWDKDRDGFVLAEGAGVVVLEELQNAKARGANIYAEVLGYAATGDGYHMTLPEQEGRGGKRCMENALQNAKVNLEQIDYINAHGTSTPAGDLCEINAIKNLFQNKIKQLKISSTKSMTGHLLGASGAIEAIFTAMAIKNDIAPPTINLDNPEEATLGMNLIAKYSQDSVINYAISNSFGFGGTNATLVLGKYN